MVSQVYLILGALGLIFALAIIGSYPNPNWSLSGAWVLSGFFGLGGLICSGFGIVAAIEESYTKDSRPLLTHTEE